MLHVNPGLGLGEAQDLNQQQDFYSDINTGVVI